jgi:mono/diheme cytochrome c family protein
MKGNLLVAWAAALTLVGAAVPAIAANDRPRPIDFAREIRPILAKNCFACHGADEKHREGGLRLDVREAALKKLDDGKTAVVPGHAEASELVRRITTAHQDDRMPPAEANATLSKDQIGLLTRWVAEGARYSLHWSFEKPTRPPVPRVSRGAGSAGPVDRFVMARLEAAGM